MLEQGAALGCVGRGRLPTQVKNSKQTLDHGDIICDVLQEWVKQGIAAGPLTWAEVQDYFGPDYTVRDDHKAKAKRRAQDNSGHVRAKGL